MMKHLLNTIIDLFLQSAHAVGVEDLGNNPEGIQSMWQAACTHLPYCGRGADGVQLVVGIIIDTITLMIGAVAVVMILYSSMQILFSGIKEDQLQAAKKTILYAVGGLILAIMARIILDFVAAFVTSIV